MVIYAHCQKNNEKAESKEKSCRRCRGSSTGWQSLKKEDILKFLGSENFSSLVDVAKYADFGVSTAIQAAFCMGYEVGKAGRHSDGE